MISNNIETQELNAEEILSPQQIDPTIIIEEGYQVKELNSIVYLPPPNNQRELIARLDAILGRKLDELSLLAQVPLPSNLSGKGFVGQICEVYLGAHAGNLPLPDFIDLNIELKTLPINNKWMPEESTYLCMVDLNPQRFISFEQSTLYHKLKHILFVLVLSPKDTLIKDKRIVGYFFYTPSNSELEAFKADYNEFNELIMNGKVNDINGSLGNLLQMRPKASSGKSILSTHDADNNLIYTRPKGYYLRRFFTTKLCQRFLEAQQHPIQTLL